MLSVLVAPAQILFIGMSFEDSLENVQRLAIGPIADSVNAKLKAMLEREARGFSDLFDACCVQPGAGRQIGVRFEKPGAARSQRAIDRALDGPHGQALVSEIDEFIPAQVRREPRVAFSNHDPKP